MWPSGRHAGGTCGTQPVDGLALCVEHAKVLRQGPGKTCAWPNCEQTSLFKPLCFFHQKRALGLLDPFRY